VRRPLAFSLAAIVALNCMSATTGCEVVTAQRLADALNSAPGLQEGLKSCSMAAMGMIESGGGNTCAHNGCCEGILQLNTGPSGLNWDLPHTLAYRNADLQTQVDGWVATANSNTSSWGYQTLRASYNSSAPIDGYQVTGGTLAACEQFGAQVCDHNVQSLEATGACGSYTDGTTHTGGQTVCSWGQHADQQAAKQNCTMGNSNGSGGTMCPGNGTEPGGIISPSPGSAPVTLPAALG
jgi:hypothetical protein